jgi:hypothetical protein
MTRILKDFLLGMKIILPAIINIICMMGFWWLLTHDHLTIALILWFGLLIILVYFIGVYFRERGHR